jgi:hypothetical protein
MSFKVVNVTLAAPVADAGTVTLAYPAGTTQASFIGANASADGAAIINDNDFYRELVSGVRVNYTYGSSDITLTNNTGVTWPAGARLTAQLGQAGGDAPALAPAPAIADAAAAGGSYVQAEANATVTKVNQILRALRSQGIIKS